MPVSAKTRTHALGGLERDDIGRSDLERFGNRIFAATASAAERERTRERA
jgi:hypothetical protein